MKITKRKKKSLSGDYDNDNDIEIIKLEKSIEDIHDIEIDDIRIPEISKKLKTRNDYINTIQEIRKLLGLEQLTNIHRKKKNERKQILVDLLTEGTSKIEAVEIQNEMNNHLNMERECVEESLFALHLCVTCVIKSISHMKLTGKYKLVNFTNSFILDPNKTKQNKTILWLIYLENRETLEPLLSPVSQYFMLMSTNILTSLKIKSNNNDVAKN